MDGKRDHRQGKPRPKRNPLNELLGSRITIRSRFGVIFVGKFTSHEEGYLKLEDVTVIGANYEIEASWVLVERGQLLHVHPADAKIAKIK